MQHELRCWPEYFQAVRSGHKTVELRRDDRPYATGDALYLREYDPMQPGYTGAYEYVRVTHVMRGGAWLAPGYVALSICLMGEDGRARVQEDFKLSYDAERAAHEDTRAALEQQRESAAHLAAAIADVDAARLTLERQIAELTHIVGTETPIAALTLAATWQAEKAHMQGRIAAIEPLSRLCIAIEGLRHAWDGLGECVDEFEPEDMAACGEYRELLDTAILAVLASVLPADGTHDKPTITPIWDELRCRVCGWPLVERIEDGCTRESCSMRPMPNPRADVGYVHMEDAP